MEAQKKTGGEEKSQGGPTVAQSSQYQQYTYQFQSQYPPHQQQQYGTFQPSGPVHSQPAIGFPQPSPPPGSAPLPYSAAGPGYYPQGFQPVSGYAVEGRPIRLHRNSCSCCGIGIGWILFIAGFFFAAIPWYVGAFILLCVGVDHKEKPGLIACTIAGCSVFVRICQFS
ncbi:60S ribosomal protein L18a-like protein [Carex littledalei]|uniref:60S ribosomal protein L18a-like protein n=1 Tax=Carex littledalei TaxID=544730 RepID=A0A833RES3_9POAL|nr:60S ribosomal protein L18a-like protein [Carex littledalei]